MQPDSADSTPSPLTGEGWDGGEHLITLLLQVSTPTLVCFVLLDKGSFLLVNSVWSVMAARTPLGTSSPWVSKERRAGFSLRTRTVAWANKPAFLQGWVP
jgi:hypothetical protein